MIGNNVLLPYTDDVVILGEFKAEIITSTLKLLENSSKMGVRNNENKIKYMIITRNPTFMQNFRFGQYLFEQVGNFEYLEVNTN